MTAKYHHYLYFIWKLKKKTNSYAFSFPKTITAGGKQSVEAYLHLAVSVEHWILQTLASNSKPQTQR